MTKENLGDGFKELTQKEMSTVSGGGWAENLFGSASGLIGGMALLASPAMPVAIGYAACATAGALGGYAVGQIKGWVK